MDGSSHRDTQIRIDFATGLFAEGLAQPPAHHGRPGGAANEQDLIDLGGGEGSRFECDMDGSQRLLDEGSDHVLIVLARQFERQVDRLSRALGQVFLLNAGEGMIRQLLLGCLR
jgi:NAD-specific glutamate dehydrogenase